MRKSAQYLGGILMLFFLISSDLWAGRNYDRRYVRLSYLEGNVVFRNEADTDWVAGSVNTPLQESDRVYAPLNSRVEIEFDDGSYLRMAEDSEVRILHLGENLIRVEMPIGLTTLRFSGRLTMEMQSPAGAIRFTEDGLYRIEVLKDGSMDLSIRKGKAEVLRSTEVLRVRRNQAILLPADTAKEIVYRQIDQEDAWDSWNDRRDAIVYASNSRRYLGPDVYIGVTPLDHFGVWINLGGSFGYGWSPAGMGYDWSPYRNGRWIYRPYWGWTWVSYEPWGWLPYHHGRWYYDSAYHWCWLPGSAMDFHFWSPGLVNFYYHGGRVSWLPLGPRDYYHHDNFFYNVRNTTYNTYIQNHDWNRMQRDVPPQHLRVPGALVSVDKQNLVNGRVFEYRQVPSHELAALKSPVSNLRDIDVQPSRSSYGPHPQISPDKLNLVDLRRNPTMDASLQNHSSIRPSIRTVDTAMGTPGNERMPSEGRRVPLSGTGGTVSSEPRSTVFREPSVNPEGRRQVGDAGSRAIYEPVRSSGVGTVRDPGNSGSPGSTPNPSGNESPAGSRRSMPTGSDRSLPSYRTGGQDNQDSGRAPRDAGSKDPINSSTGPYESRRRTVPAIDVPSGNPGRSTETNPGNNPGSSSRRDMGTVNDRPSGNSSPVDVRRRDEGSGPSKTVSPTETPTTAPAQRRSVPREEKPNPTYSSNRSSDSYRRDTEYTPSTGGFSGSSRNNTAFYDRSQSSRSDYSGSQRADGSFNNQSPIRRGGTWGSSANSFSGSSRGSLLSGSRGDSTRSTPSRRRDK